MSSKRNCCHYAYPLDEEHRHYIESEEHDNCVLCLAERKGSMTLEEVGRISRYN